MPKIILESVLNSDEDKNPISKIHHTHTIDHSEQSPIDGFCDDQVDVPILMVLMKNQIKNNFKE